MTALHCIVCGGDHDPVAGICDEAGMDREIERMGALKWNKITGLAMRKSFNEMLRTHGQSARDEK